MTIALFEGKAKINASRYSLLRDHQDHGCFMIIEKDDLGNLAIIEEHTETLAAPESAPPPLDRAEAVTVLIHQQVTQLNKHLPLMVDDDTRLDVVKMVNPRTLQYRYTLVGCAFEDVDLSATTVALQSLTKPQSCEAPALKKKSSNAVGPFYTSITTRRENHSSRWT
ncbi:MAG: hypothetical protein ACREIA_25925 [Opitutaceae bacterium]